jgi:N-methylhydantoinase B
MMNARTYEPIDDAALMVIESRCKTIARETGARALRGIQSPSASLYSDLSTAFLDRKERILGEGGWLTGYDCGADVPLRNVLDYIGRDNIFPGDFIITNDPFIMKHGHLPDWAFYLPVFYKDDLVSYLVFKTHQYDTGGAFPGCYAPRGYDAHSEGLIIPPLKIFEKGVENKALYKLILNNVRGREIVRWDNLLIRGSMLKAAEGVVELFKRYGREGTEQAFDQIVETTEKAVRRIISKWPAGTYWSERAADWDGTRDEPVWVRCALTVRPEEGQLIFDFSESDSGREFINAPIGVTTAHARLAVIQSLPADISHNQGIYNCITVLAKEGTVCNLKYPSTNGAQGCTVGTGIVECGQLALAQIIPQDVSASWTKHLQPIPYGKVRNQIDPRTGNVKYYRLAPMTSDGGSGAIWGYDGWDGVGSVFGAGNFLRAPIELVERETPYRYLCCEWITDSAGDGQFRGSVGTHVEYLNEMDRASFVQGDAGIQTGNSDGQKFEGFGLLGGKPGYKNEMWIKRKDQLIPLRCIDHVTDIQPGDVIITKSGGGGGVGDPLDRDVEMVRMDVLNRYVSVNKAKDVYGIVVDPDTFEVDYAATDKLRKQMKSGR